MKFNFTQISDKLPYPPALKAKLSMYHVAVVDWVIHNYLGTFKQRQQIVDTINSISYYVLDGNAEFEQSWKWDDPISSVVRVDPDTCKSSLNSLYVIERDINWDVSVSDDTVQAKSSLQSKIETKVESIREKNSPGKYSLTEGSAQIKQTPKSDLYIQPPVIPQFDFNKVWAIGDVDNCRYVIYESEPKIPTKQNEISATTDVDKMLASDLLKLFPNQFIPTRAPSLYEDYPGLHRHDTLGVILPIEGFTEDEVLDNIIKYPHIFRLMKYVGSDIVSFYTTIEVNGELHKFSEYWKTLPESFLMPYNTDFLKEYVVRRYLLERDIKGMKHKYPMVGDLDPYLTLFTTPSDYQRFGISDVVELARKCVASRVAYKRSRNPVLRRLSDA